MYQKNNDNSFKTAEWLSPVLRGSLLGLAAILLLFVLSSLLLSFGILPLGVAPAAASISMAIGSFLSGWFAAKKLEKNGLLVGLICGAALFLLFTIIGLAAFGETPQISTLIRLVIFVISAAIGGILGVGNSNKRKIV